MVTNNIHYIVLICIITIIFYISNFYIFNKKKIKKFKNILDLLDYNFNKKKELNIESNNNNLLTNNTLSTNNIISNNEIKKNSIKKKMKYILIINKNDNYYFYDKHNKNYMKINLLNNKKINIKNNKNENIGNLISEKYNKLTFNIIFYKNNLNIEYINNFNAIKLYLDNDDKVFYIKKNYNINNKSNNIYNIYLYALNIGKINYNSITNIYRINIYEEYKIYLNLIGFGCILLEKYV